MAEEVRLLSIFKEKICDCIGLVCKMHNHDRIAAVQFWNQVSDRLQSVLDKSVGLSLNLTGKIELMSLATNHAPSIKMDTSRMKKSVTRVAVETSKSEQGEQSEREVDACGQITNGEVVVHSKFEHKQQALDELIVSDVDAEAEDRVKIDKKVVNYIIVEEQQHEEIIETTENSGEMTQQPQPQSFFIIEPDKPIRQTEETVLQDEADETELDGDLKEKVLVLQNDLTVDITRGPEEFHPDDNFDGMVADDKISGVSLESCQNETVVVESREESDSYHCDICDKPFFTFFAFTSHSWQHTKPFKCSTCNQGFSTKGSLVVHNRKHSGEKPYSCTTCSARFTTQGNLKRHLQSHTGVKPWVCNVCNSRFTEKKSLKVHQRIHTGERPYKCKLCEQSFSQRSTLRSHLAVHTKRKPHTCDLCGRSFSQKSNLTSHKSRHYSVRNFSCDYCECKFHNKGDLIRHTKGHANDRSLTCEVCSKTFSRQNNLTDHLNRHYDIKPWQCGLCQLRFFTRLQVKQHLKEKHGMGGGSSEGTTGQLLDIDDESLLDNIKKLDVVKQDEQQVVNMEVEDLEEEMLGDMVIHVDADTGLVLPPILESK